MRELEEARHQQPRTICAKLNALTGYYRTAVLDGRIAASPCAYVHRPRIQRISSTNYLSARQLLLVLETARAHHVRDHAIFCLLGYNGLRAAEVVGIDVTDLMFEQWFHTVVVHRKGGKVQHLPLAPRTMAAVEAVKDGRTEGPLFTSFRTPDKRITRSDLQRLVKRYARWCKIPQRISPHSFRHSFVTLSLNAGMNPRDIQNSCGHDDPRSTSYYDRDRETLARNSTFGMSAYVEGT